MTATARDVRLRAAELIELRDWWQAPPGTHSGRGPDGQICASVALSDAAEELAGGLNLLSESLFRKTRCEVMTELRVSDLVGWNDARERTKAEVLAALRGGGA